MSTYYPVDCSHGDARGAAVRGEGVGLGVEGAIALMLSDANFSLYILIFLVNYEDFMVLGNNKT